MVHSSAVVVPEADPAGGGSPVTAADTARNTSETTGPVLSRPHFAGFESLRALAAVMVVMHHAVSLAGPTRAGRLATPAAVMDGGVAVFFVLSGFLIYRPLVAAHLSGRPGPRWRSFWWRRALRIVPAYWAVLSFFWFIGSFDLGRDWWRHYLFLQNYSASTVLRGVSQAWSLGTEVTFYLMVPLFAAGLVRLSRGAALRSRPVVQLGGCAALWLTGIGSRVAVERWAPGQRGLSFNWLPTNLDLFATGMALAVLSAWAVDDVALRRRLDRLAASAWPWWATAVALFAWYAYRVGAADFATGYSGWFWHRRQLGLGLFTVLLMVPAVFGDQQRGLLRRVWSWRPLVWVGSVSYGLYLWHFDWMKRSLLFEGRPGWISSLAGDASPVYLFAVGLGVGLLSAAASWYLLEEPLQRFRSLVGGPRRRVGALGPPEGPG